VSQSSPKVSKSRTASDFVIIHKKKQPEEIQEPLSIDSPALTHIDEIDSPAHESDVSETECKAETLPAISQEEVISRLEWVATVFYFFTVW